MISGLIQKKAQDTLKKIARLKDIIEPYKSLNDEYQELLDWQEILKNEPDIHLEQESEKNIINFLKRFNDYQFQTLLSGEYDDRNALVEISAGAGGSEACDWASILFRMYSRWAQEKNYKLEILSETPGDVTGYRNLSFLVTGRSAYGYLKAETGVHRLVRISPFDANARRHTSFARLEILPEVEESEYIVNMDEIKVETLRAGGAGGQHVNKTESAVRLTHLPSGISVQCQNERSQHANKESALRVLEARLAKIQRIQDDQKIKSLQGNVGPAEWGRQIRSYVMQPYTLVKDHRTGHETGNVIAVIDGEIQDFIDAYLRNQDCEKNFIE